MNLRVVCLPAHDFAFLGEGMKLAVVFFLPSLYNKGSRCPAAAPDRRRSLMKKRGWILGLAALTLLSGCGAFPAESGVTEAVLGETVSTGGSTARWRRRRHGSPMRAIQPPAEISWWWWSWS